MEVVNIFYYLAVILIFAKSFGLLARKLGLPQVAGMVVAGVIVGLLGNFHRDDNALLRLFIMKPTKEEMSVLNAFSQVGVVLILFSSGLETDLQNSDTAVYARPLSLCRGFWFPWLSERRARSCL